MIWLVWLAAALALAAGIVLFLIAPGTSKRKGRCDALLGWDYAHRGLFDAASGITENSLAAFELATQSGYGIELDVQTTRDGALVVCHDWTLRRLFGLDAVVTEMTLAELRLSAPEIPTLAEALHTVAGRCPLIVELKSRKIGDTQLSARVRNALRDYDGPYCVESFDPLQMRWFKRHAQEIVRGQLLSGHGAHLLTHFLSRPDLVVYPFEKGEGFLFRLMRAAFHPVTAAWTTRTMADYERLSRQCDAQIFEGIRPPARAGQLQQEKEKPE